MNIFPMIQPDLVEIQNELPLYKEIDWDFEINQPLYKNGRPITTSGAKAVLVWAWKALHTERFRYEIYTLDYGTELETLTGKSSANEFRKSEATRYIKEALLINPYITSIDNIEIEFFEDNINIDCVINTIYGEVKLNV